MNRDIPFGQPPSGNAKLDEWLSQLYLSIQDWAQLPFGTSATQFLQYDPTSSRRIKWSVPAGGTGCDCDAIDARLDELEEYVRLLALGAGYPMPGLSTSYGNTGGTGDRRTIIVSTMGPSDLFTASNPTSSLSKMIDGVNAQHPWGAPGGNNTGYYMRFDFGAPVWINEFTWRGGQRTYGQWKWQVSTDGISWGDIPGSTFMLDLMVPTSGIDTVFPLGSPVNGFAYRYYQMIGTGGGTFSGTGGFTQEIEFKIYGL